MFQVKTLNVDIDCISSRREFRAAIVGVGLPDVKLTGLGIKQESGVIWAAKSAILTALFALHQSWTSLSVFGVA
jgi:hypothetical protein